MTRKGVCARFPAWNREPRRALPCRDQASICRMPPKASRASRICPNRRSSNVAETSDDNCAQPVGTVPIGIVGRGGCCMIWGICDLVVHTTCTSPIRSIIAPSVANTSTQTCRTWPCQGRITRTAWSPWPSVWWSKTACRTKRPVGTYGETIACSCLSPPSRTGLRPGGKKAEARIDADYLDWALADFSGYIAADELYDGPYCVLSIVDNRTFKRISYRVLDHDPTHDDIC